MKQNVWRLIRQGAIAILACLLIAVGIQCFARPAAFPMTGFSGLALLANRLWGLPLGAVTVALNIPVVLACHRILGRRFLMRSVLYMLLSSFMMDWVAPFLPVYHGERLLAALCTAVFCGLGYGFIYLQEASTGGSDFIILSIRARRPHLSLGTVSFLCEAAVVTLGAIVLRDGEGLLYGMAVSYLMGAVIDKVQYGAGAGKLAIVVTARGDSVTLAIGEETGRGVTCLNGKGGYTGNQKTVLLCACSNKDLTALQRVVKQTDPSAFLIVLESSEVRGEGFKAF